jgi:hypothetical protein
MKEILIEQFFQGSIGRGVQYTDQLPPYLVEMQRY